MAGEERPANTGGSVEDTTLLATQPAARSDGPIADNRASLTPGDVLAGRFRVLRMIARGGMGEVYEAVDEALGSRLALKTVRVEQEHSTRALDRFRHEILLARKIAHPNVCKVYELHLGARGEPPLLLTMELLDGETLGRRLEREGPFSEAAALVIVRQIAAALSAAHAEGVVHRDLKPSNVMLVPAPRGGERVVVMDFGIARALDELSDRASTVDAPIGTPAYMAPEQLTAAPISPATDIYALGLLLYELTTGKPPFEGCKPEQIAVQRLNAPPPDPKTVALGLSRRWSRTTRWCLSIDPGHRPRSPDVVVQALVGRQSVPWTWHSWRSVAVTALVGAAVIAAIGLRGYQGGQRRPAPPLPTRPAVALLQATNLTGEKALDWITAAMPEVLAAELEPVEGVRIIPPTVVSERQLSLGVTPDVSRSTVISSGFDAARERQLADSLGARQLLILSFERFQGQELKWNVGLKLPGPEPLLAQASTQAPVGSLEAAARALATELRKAMHWQPGAPQSRSPMIPEKALPDAARARISYAEGLRHLMRVDGRRASSRFLETIQSDATFLPAHARLLEAENLLRQFWWNTRLWKHAENALAAAAGARPSPDRTWVEAWGLAALARWPDAHAKLLPWLKSTHDDPELRLVDVLISPAEVGYPELAEMRASPPPMGNDPRIELYEALNRRDNFQPEVALEAIARGAAEAERRGDHLVLARLLTEKSQTLFDLARAMEATHASVAAERAALEAGATGLVFEIRLGRAQRLAWWGRHSESSSVFRELLSDLTSDADPEQWRPRLLIELAVNEFQVGNVRGMNDALGQLGRLVLEPREAGVVRLLRLASGTPSLSPPGRVAALRQALSACGDDQACKHMPAMLLVYELLQQDRLSEAAQSLKELGPDAPSGGTFGFLYLRVMAALGRCPEAYAELEPFLRSNRMLDRLTAGAHVKRALASCLIQMKSLEQAESLAASIAPYFLNSDRLTDRAEWLLLESELALAHRRAPWGLLQKESTFVASPEVKARPCLGAEVRVYQGRLSALAQGGGLARTLLSSAEREARSSGCLYAARLAYEARTRLEQPVAK